MESVATGKPSRAVDYKSTPAASHVDLELASIGALLPLAALRNRAEEAWLKHEPNGAAQDFDAAFGGACSAEDFFLAWPPAPSLYIPLRIQPLDAAGAARRELTALLKDANSPPGAVVVASGGAGKTVTARKAYFDCLRGPTALRLLRSEASRARQGPVDLSPPLGGYLPIWLDLSRCEEHLVRTGASPNLICALLGCSSGMNGMPPEGVKRWLTNGPRVLLFVELDNVPLKSRALVAKALRAWQELHAGNGHATIVTLRPPPAGDKTLARLKESPSFGIFGLCLPETDELLCYFRALRDLELRLFARLGLPRPERDFLTEYLNLERIVARQLSSAESLVLTPLLMHWLSLLRGAAVSGVETVSDLHRRVVENQVAMDLLRAGAFAGGDGLCDKIGQAILGLARLSVAIHAETSRGKRLTLELAREVLLAPTTALPRVVEAPFDGFPCEEWMKLPCWAAVLSGEDAANALGSSLLVHHGDTLDFGIDSLRAYFLGAVALAPTGLKGDWTHRLLRLFRQDPPSWELPTRFLGGAMTRSQMEELAETFVLAAPDACLPRLLGTLLRGRPKSFEEAQSLEAIEDTLTKRSFILGSCPELLLQECHNGLHWYDAGQNHCRKLAQKLRQEAGEQRRGWFRLLSNPHTSSTTAMTEHQRSVLAVAVLPDGRVVSAGEDQLVKVWDSKLGKVRTMSEHRGAVTALLITADGRVASASQDRTIKLWDMRGAATTLAGHTKPVTVLALHGRYGLLSGSQDNTVRMWDMRSGQSRVILQHADQVRALGVLPGGSVLSGGADGLVKLWDQETSSASTLLEHQGAVLALIVLSDGHLVTGSEDRTIRLWDSVRGGAQVLNGHSGAVTALAARADCCFASGSSDGAVKLWNPRTEAVETLAEHTAAVTAVAFLPDGRVVSAAEDYTVRVWDPGRATVRVMKEHRDRVRALAVGADGVVVSGGHDFAVRTWNPAMRAAGTLSEAIAPVQAVSCHQDGRVVSAGADGAVRLWDSRRGEPVVLARHNGWVTCLSIAPDGTVASGGADAAVKIIEPKGGQAAVMKAHTQKVWAVAVCPGGLVASSSLDGTVKLWDPKSGQIKSMGEHQGQVWPIAALPGGRLASGGTDKTVRLWDPRTNDVDLLGSHEGWVWALVVLTDGRLASCGADHTVRVWDLQTSACLTMEEHTDVVRFLGALPDGRVASAGFDRTVKVWDPGTGRVDTLKQHRGAILGLSVLADGRVATGSEDGTVKLWNPATGDVLTHVADAPPTCVACPFGLPSVAFGCTDGSVSLLAVEPEATDLRRKA